MDEGERLEAGIVSESKKEVEILTLKYVENGNGECADIIFRNNDKSISLKQLLPGDYRIKIHQGDPDEKDLIAAYDHSRKLILVNSKYFLDGQNSLGFIAAILHEAGHYKEATSMTSESAQTLATVYNNIIALELASKYRENGLKLEEEDVENLRVKLIKSLELFGIPNEILQTSLETFNISDLKLLTSNKTEESLQSFTEGIRADLVAMQIYSSRLRERTAWQYALKAAREMKRIGVVDFRNKDLIQVVEDSLISHDNVSGVRWLCYRPWEKRSRFYKHTNSKHA